MTVLRPSRNIEYMTTDGRRHGNPKNAIQHQRMLNVSQVLKDGGLLGKVCSLARIIIAEREKIKEALDVRIEDK